MSIIININDSVHSPWADIAPEPSLTQRVGEATNRRLSWGFLWKKKNQDWEVILMQKPTESGD